MNTRLRSRLISLRSKRCYIARLSYVLIVVTLTSLAGTSFAQVRSYDGTGNNAVNQASGAAGQPYVRWASSEYSDGLATPAGENRPNPRVISNAIGRQVTSRLSQRGLTSMAWQWGQFIDHDIALSSGTEEFFPIPVSDGDALAPLIPMTRSQFDLTTGVTSPREQVNSTSSFLDASMIYGPSADRAAALRSMVGGRLKMTNEGLLPFNTLGFANANDTGQFPEDQLFLAGDVRANEQPGLTAMHTLFVREHNRLTDELAIANPQWSDEQLYQHGRRIVAGLVQSITYNEFLPLVIGDFTPPITQYRADVDATLSNEFATAAFRFGHTMVTDHLLLAAADQSMDPIPMKDAFFNPTLIANGQDVDGFLSGLMNQTQNESDTQIVEDLRSMLFGQPGSGGMDLMALNIQRGRDHGLPSYNAVAQQFAFDPIEQFMDLTGDAELAATLEELYGGPDDIDLWVGLLASDRVPGTEFGSLLNEMVSNQFRRLMEGDRYFFAWEDGLSETEKLAIMNTRLSDVMARNTGLTDVPANVFVRAIPEPSTLPIWLLLTGSLSIRHR